MAIQQSINQGITGAMFLLSQSPMMEARRTKKKLEVEKREELENVLKEALAINKPVIIDYRIDSDKKVFPMVAPGAPIHQIINEEDIEC